MRSIEAKFSEIAEAQPYLSSLMCLCGAVRHGDFNRRAIVQNLNKLVAKTDYAPSDRNRVIEHLVALSKRPNEQHISGQNSPKQGVKTPTWADMYCQELLTPKSRKI